MAELYSTWLENDPQTIPRKFQPKQIVGETEAQKLIRKGCAINKMKCEIDILKLRVTNGKQQYEAIDNHMITVIQEKFPDNINLQSKFKSYWNQQCELEEEKSKKHWENKQEWFSTQELEPPTGNNSNNNANETSLPQQQRMTANNQYPFRKPTRIPRRNNNNNRPPRNKWTERRQHFGNPRYDAQQHPSQHQHRRQNAQLEHLDQQRPQYQQRQHQRQDSITEEITQNFPQQIPRTLSDSFLPRGRPRTWRTTDEHISESDRQLQ